MRDMYWRPTTRMLLALVAVLAFTACGSAGTDDPRGPGPADPTTRAVDPQASPSDPAGASATDRDPSAVSGGESADWLLENGDLPQGWRRATGQQHLGVPEVCGVRLEPPALASASTRRYTQAFDGPFVVQYSFVASDEASAAARMDEWVAAAESCTESELDGTPVEVSPLEGLTPRGEQFAAVHVSAPSARTSGAQRDYVAFRQGTHVTVLLSYTVRDLAPVSVLDALAARIADRA